MVLVSLLNSRTSFKSIKAITAVIAKINTSVMSIMLAKDFESSFELLVWAKSSLISAKSFVILSKDCEVSSVRL